VVTMMNARSTTEAAKTGMGTVICFDPMRALAGDRVTYELVAFGKPAKTQALIRIDAMDTDNH